MQEETFRTNLTPSSKNNLIDYDSTIVLFGSCFSENIGTKLKYFGFDSLTNPYGILFNPVAINRAIKECINGKRYTKEDLFFHNEQYHSYNLHSDFSNSNADLVLEKINSTIATTQKKLKQASHIIITLGTASVYEHLEEKTIVANCHKVPQKTFSKHLLSVTDISNELKEITQNIQTLNNSVQIMFTVSPIRHLKDGLIENSRSKANLIAAVHNSLESNSYYFPSYEIMNDDLRDYRFYEHDMIHPNKTAINYIWNFFKKEWLSGKTDNIIKEVDSIQKGKSHKAFNPESKSHKLFLDKLSLKEENLKKKFNIQL